MSDKGLGQLEKLTIGERLLIDRRRRGETQREAALRNAIAPYTYGQWERDEEIGPEVKVGSLETYERCLLYRRRSSVYQFQVANALKRSRFWINLMERGEAPCDELLWYWEQ